MDALQNCQCLLEDYNRVCFCSYWFI